jgi:hypothetical protein
MSCTSFDFLQRPTAKKWTSGAHGALRSPYHIQRPVSAHNPRRVLPLKSQLPAGKDTLNRQFWSPIPVFGVLLLPAPLRCKASPFSPLISTLQGVRDGQSSTRRKGIYHGKHHQISFSAFLPFRLGSVDSAVICDCSQQKLSSRCFRSS